VLSRGVPYHHRGADRFDRLRPEQQARDHARRLAAPGYDVILTPVPAA
jgi:hypothetical protein